MVKVLVTGGAGFIGSHIVDILIERGHDVVVIDNLSTGNARYVNDKAVFYGVDIIKDGEMDVVFYREKPEIVIHCAAQVMLRKSLKDPVYDAKVNILGTINVLETCRRFKIKKLIYTSTGGARVGEPEYLPVDEKHSLKPLSGYGISKHSAEHYVEMYGKLYGLDYFIFCFGNVYGPRDNPEFGRVVSVFIDSIMNNQNPEIFGDGEQTRDFIHVLDLAEFIVDNLEKTGKSKLYHLADGKEVSVNQIFEMLKEISGFWGEVKHVNAIKGEVRKIVLDTRLAKEELGWMPKRDIKEGLKGTFDWFRNGRK